MLRKLRVFYYNNKVAVWVVAGFIIFVYVIIRLLNYNIMKKNNEEIADTENNINTSTAATKNFNTYLSSSNSTALNDSTVDEEKGENDKILIDQFIAFCNNKEIESAYNMLSQDCKDKEFTTQESFEEDYINEIFNEYRSYDVEAWEKNGKNVVYRIRLHNNIMSSGKVDNTYTEEYITIIDQDNERKLNINHFIGKDEIGVTSNQENIEITVINKYKYYNYEQYDIKIKDNGNEAITLDTKENTKSVYVEDDKETTYTWFGNEVPTNHLTLQSGEERTYRIKFNELYMSRKKDETIYFTDVHIGEKKLEKNIKVDLQQ